MYWEKLLYNYSIKKNEKQGGRPMGKELPLKKCSEIGYCGINCSLCPKRYTESRSHCGGCCGDKKLSIFDYCSFIPCAGVKRGIEFCGECEEYPCEKLEKYIKKDSYVTHKNVIPNLDRIKEGKLEELLKESEEKKEVLEYLLERYNSGRNKSFYCQALSLLDFEKIKKTVERADNMVKELPLKERSKFMRTNIESLAMKEKVNLKLRKKPE